MRLSTAFVPLLSAGLLAAAAAAGKLPAQPANGGEWARVTEDERAVKVETDKLEAVIPKKDPMTSLVAAAKLCDV